MLSHEQVQPIAQRVSVVLCGLRRLPGSNCWLGVGVEGADLLHRADADAIRFPQCTIDCASLSKPHLRATHDSRDIAGIRIAVTGKAFTLFRLERHRPKSPSGLSRHTEIRHRLNANSYTSLASRQPQESS